MAEAVGMLEVFGLATAFAAADAGCKAGNVWLENFDKNKPGNADELPVPLIVMIKFRGSVSDVQAALEAAKAKAEQLAGVVNEYEIARPTEDTEKMLKISAFDKGTPHKINKEEIIDELNQELKARHVRRLREGKCTIEQGFILSDITTSLERIADHCSNIAVCILQVAEDSFDTHSYLNAVKREDNATFQRRMEETRKQYPLP